MKRVLVTDTEELARSFAVDGKYELLTKNPGETTVVFKLDDNHSVRLMCAHDLDKDVPNSYHQSTRAKDAAARAKALFNEPDMHVQMQKHVMARLLTQVISDSNQLKQRCCSKALIDLRADARRYYWLELNGEDERRACARRAFGQTAEELVPYLDAIDESWKSAWNNGKRDVDFFK
ncbi:hypothetical protein BJ170DRAFT_8068 [Xylariales sp. AK1849]|nr:hypothetical protein BJ170DRAFT_8068 [Xylariales sp. AK1849]